MDKSLVPAFQDPAPRDWDVNRKRNLFCGIRLHLFFQRLFCFPLRKDRLDSFPSDRVKDLKIFPGHHINKENNYSYRYKDKEPVLFK